MSEFNQHSTHKELIRQLRQEIETLEKKIEYLEGKTFCGSDLSPMGTTGDYTDRMGNRYTKQ